MFFKNFFGRLFKRKKQAKKQEGPKTRRNLGGSIVSKNILEGKGKLKWCVRAEPVDPVDNGWRFWSDIDTDEYLTDPHNAKVLPWDAVVEIEPAVEYIFNCPPDIYLALEEEDGKKCFYDTDTEELIFKV